MEVVEQTPDRPALIFQSETYTFSMLRDLSAAFAIRLRDAGVGPNSTVQIQADDLAVVISVMLATSCLGARLIERAITDKMPLGFPITHSIVVAPEDGIQNQIIVDQSFSPNKFEALEKEKIWRDSAVDPETPWIIVSTSGTTGLPKVVGLSQRLVCKRSDAVRNDFESGVTKFASLFPYSSRPFFARAIAAILNGATIVDRGPWAFWLESGVNMVAGSLSQVQSFTDIGAQAQKIAKLEVIGAKLLEVDVVNFLRSFELVDDTYGATETNKTYSNLYSIGLDGLLQTRGHSYESSIEVVDENDDLIAAGRPGTVRVKTDCAAEKYLFSVNGETHVLREGWFYPGDIARWGKNGVLDVIRRTSEDVIVSGSSKINAKLIEFVLKSLNGIVEAAVFTNPKKNTDEIIAFAVFEEDVNRLQIVELAKHACRDQFGKEFVPAKIWPINILPKYEDGALDRAKCVSMISEAIDAG
ncbi:MAG: acyl--CoA ligase [Rhodobacteraceae bacterium]|nr:acyl--CoA ligase [Paracoccaceae bacterium]